MQMFHSFKNTTVDFVGFNFFGNIKKIDLFIPIMGGYFNLHRQVCGEFVKEKSLMKRKR
jgi:hypothetical protein